MSAFWVITIPRRGVIRPPIAPLGHAADALRLNVSANWLPTPSLAGGRASELLAAQDAVFAAPGSPYQSLEGMLAGIEFARRQGLPFLATCGGFQYTLTEYARHALGLTDANTEENGADSPAPVIARAPCPLSGPRCLKLATDSVLARIYGTLRLAEEYFCSFEVNPDYVTRLQQGGLRLSASAKREAARPSTPPASVFCGNAVPAPTEFPGT